MPGVRARLVTCMVLDWGMISRAHARTDGWMDGLDGRVRRQLVYVFTYHYHYPLSHITITKHISTRAAAR